MHFVTNCCKRSGVPQMTDFLTTRELAALLRVKERKIYDLVAAGALPVRRVTGKLLFPRDEIDTWLGAQSRHKGADRVADRAPLVHRGPPLVVAGSHDPLLEWALRESRSGIAAFLDGAVDGLNRAASGDCIVAGLHLPEDDGWNVAAVASGFGDKPWVLIEWAKRTRGLVIRPGLIKPPTSLTEARGLRFQARQPEAGSQLVLDRLLAREHLKRVDLRLVDGVERSETDLALAISAGRADVGLGIAASARQFNLGFVPLIEERFDLLIWRRAYFDPPMQKFLAFCRSEPFRQRAETMGGYDVKAFGAVHFNGG
jgi:excisionase family DNA binding protein